MEHIFATSTIIQNAVQNGLPLSVPLTSRLFLGQYSSAHIQYGSSYPTPIRSEIVHIQCLSQLSARVVTKNWSTPSFPVSRGVFQGDTLSPLIFLITFNRIIQLAQSLSTCGFQLKLSDPHHTTKQLGKAPPHDSCICKAHQIECKRKYSKHEYTLRWVTAMSQEKTDLAVT